MQKINQFMSSLIIPNKTTLEPFQKGVLMTNRALVLFYHSMKVQSKVEYILPNRLNQDVLEHFFGAIRSKGGLNDHPTPKDFKTN